MNIQLYMCFYFVSNVLRSFFFFFSFLLFGFSFSSFMSLSLSWLPQLFVLFVLFVFPHIMCACTKPIVCKHSCFFSMSRQ
jgi:hypothetical protein